jgi:2-methylisocitrate lyase-like PEP mutase family enzyme
VEEIERIAAEVDAPLLLNTVPGGLTPEVAPARLAELGFRVSIHPGVALGAVAEAAIEALGALGERTLRTTPDPAGFFDLFGLTAWNELGQRYRAHDRQGAGAA